MLDLRAVFGATRSPAFFARLAPTLSVGAEIGFVPDARDDCARGGGGATLGPAGYGIVRDVLSRDDARALSAAIDALVEAGLPATFAYVFDAAWAPLERLASLARAELGAFDVLADIWAFRVVPGNTGWPAHRGFSEPEPERTMINVWVALTDADETTSCMFVLPLPDDPHYPAELGSIEAPREAFVALPVRAGSAAAWDAATLHYGGPIRHDAPEPRRSITFTLRKRSARRADLPVLDVARFGFEERLDLIAEEILKYASKERASDAVMEWARLRTLTRQVAASMRQVTAAR